MEDTSRYPIGKFKAPEAYTSDYLAERIQAIAQFPEQLKNEVMHLTDEQLDTPYRDGGWTIRQVVHHCADSHMNCFIRIKWTLTEDNPTIKFYYEDRWGDMVDNTTMPVGPSLAFLEGLHFRLAYLMKRLSATDLEKSFIHPEHNASFQIKEIIGTYAWHGLHHLAHITELKKRKGW
jgi:hypothetical protein